MTKTRLKDTLASSAGISTSPLPATTAPAVTPAVSAPSVTPAAPKPRVTASALIEQDIEETFLAYRTKLQELESVEEEVSSLEGELDDLKDRYPRQYREVSDRLGVDLEFPAKESKVQLPKFSEFQLGQTAVLAILIGFVVLGILWTWWNNPSQEGSLLPEATTVVQVEGNLTGFEPLPTATSESVGMIIIPTPSTVAEATAVVEETAVPTAVPPTAKPKPPTAVPPKVVQPTAVPYFSYNSGEYGSTVVPSGVVCWGDAVAWDGNKYGDGVGPGDPVYTVIPNPTTVYLVWGSCVSESWEVVSKRLSTDPNTKDKNFVKVP